MTQVEVFGVLKNSINISFLKTEERPSSGEKYRYTFALDGQKFDVLSFKILATDAMWEMARDYMNGIDRPWNAALTIELASELL